MANTSRVMNSIKDFLIKLKASDADIPEELAEDACEMVEEVKDALCEDEEVEEEVKTEDEEEKKEEKAEDEEAVTKAELEKSVEDSMVKVLRKYGVIRDTSMDALDELENKLGKEESEDEMKEEEVTVDPKKMNDSVKREILRQIKPVIASVKDSKTRKKLSDQFAKALDMQYATTSDYSNILDIVKENRANDMKTVDNDADFGMEIAKKYNPHYKEV